MIFINNMSMLHLSIKFVGIKYKQEDTNFAELQIKTDMLVKHHAPGGVILDQRVKVTWGSKLMSSETA